MTEIRTVKFNTWEELVKEALRLEKLGCISKMGGKE